jgi:hypothetical protein
MYSIHNNKKYTISEQELKNWRFTRFEIWTNLFLKIFMVRSSNKCVFISLTVIRYDFIKTPGEKILDRHDFVKSCLLTINLDMEKATVLAGIFGCKLVTFPFTYLVLHLGLLRAQIRDLSPLYSRINQRIASMPLLSLWWNNHGDQNHPYFLAHLLSLHP